MQLNGVMMVIIGGLTDIAANDMGAQVRGNSFSTDLAPYRGSLELLSAVPPPYTLSWFTYDVVRQALGVVAAWSLQPVILPVTCRPVGFKILRDEIYFRHSSLAANHGQLAEVGGSEGRERNSSSS